jgi:hypothetical protein
MPFFLGEHKDRHGPVEGVEERSEDVIRWRLTAEGTLQGAGQWGG